MKSIINTNYSLDIEENTINLNRHTPLFIKIYSPEKAPKKSLLSKAKRTLKKLQPTHWFDGVWDDLSVKL